MTSNNTEVLDPKLAIAILAVLLTLASCKKECDTACQNSGTVTETCGCDCPSGFSGEFCERTIPPNSMTIERIVVEHWPYLRENGDHWDGNYGPYAESDDDQDPNCSAPYIDLAGSPDLYVKLIRGSNILLRTTTQEACQMNTTPQFDLGAPLTLVSLDTEHIIRLYDDDCDATDADDLIAGYTFQPSALANGRPSSVAITNSTTWHQVRLRLYVTWN